MKSFILGATVFAMTSSFAGFENVEITDFTGSYKRPDGSATASKLQVPESVTSTINIELKGIEDGYLLQYGDKEFVFKNPPAFINDVETANWNGINYKTSNNKMTASLNSLKSDVTGSRMDINRFSGNCSLNREHAGDYALQLMDACLTNSNFSISSLVSGSTESFYNLLIDLPGMEGINANDISISNATLKVSKNSFDFKGRVDLGMSANVKISGESSLDIENNRVIIRIDKAKASFLNIKKKLFEELKKSESMTVRVQNPYIVIYLK